MTDKEHSCLHISCQECARASRSLRFVARARLMHIWTEAQRLWLRPRHPRHPAVSSNLLRLSLFLRHTLMSAINYTSTFFWGCFLQIHSFLYPFCTVNYELIQFEASRGASVYLYVCMWTSVISHIHMDTQAMHFVFSFKQYVMICNLTTFFFIIYIDF